MLEMARPTSKFMMIIDTINKKAVNRICVVQSYSICSLVNCGTKLVSEYIFAPKISFMSSLTLPGLCS